jgi:hypothetical protein
MSLKSRMYKFRYLSKGGFADVPGTGGVPMPGEVTIPAQYVRLPDEWHTVEAHGADLEAARRQCSLEYGVPVAAIQTVAGTDGSPEARPITLTPSSHSAGDFRFGRGDYQD